MPKYVYFMEFEMCERDENLIDNTQLIGEHKFASPRWDISQERAFLENLLGQRTNFLLVFFAAVVAGAINTRDFKNVQMIILVSGLVACSLLSLAIFRSQAKLDIILSHLYTIKSHPAAFVNRKAGPQSRRKIIGYGIPLLCISTLGILLFAVVSGAFTINGSNTSPAAYSTGCESK